MKKIEIPRDGNCFFHSFTVLLLCYYEVSRKNSNYNFQEILFKLGNKITLEKFEKLLANRDLWLQELSQILRDHAANLLENPENIEQVLKITLPSKLKQYYLELAMGMMFLVL
jgi:hypothetical protein